MSESRGGRTQGVRSHARDARGKPVKGIYVRGEAFIAGFRLNGRWRMKFLRARSLHEAIHEREELLVRLGRSSGPAADSTTDVRSFDQLYSDARKLADRLSKSRHLGNPEMRRYLAEAERLAGDAADALHKAWTLR